MMISDVLGGVRPRRAPSRALGASGVAAAKGVSAVRGTGRTSQIAAGGRSVEVVDSRAEIRDFLTTRRARITPEQAGLPSYGGHRRVSGLRREEVALLAGVSVDY